MNPEFSVQPLPQLTTSLAQTFNVIFIESVSSAGGALQVAWAETTWEVKGAVFVGLSGLLSLSSLLSLLIPLISM